MSITIDSFRDKLSLAIASSLDSDATTGGTILMLDPVLDEAIFSANCDDNNDDDDADELLNEVARITSVAPLLVAADKGHVACLKYLANQYITAGNHSNNGAILLLTKSQRIILAGIIGSPTEASPAKDGGNTAVHHAAASGCAAAWAIFHSMLLSEHRNTRIWNEQDNNNNNNDIYLQLGRVTNCHGDTPFQMAAPMGHLEFIQTWYLLCLQEQEEPSWQNKNDQKASAKQILQAANNAGDTVISLASCHGHVQLLQYLLQICQIPVCHEDVIKCQDAIDRTEAGIRMVQQQQKQQHDKSVGSVVRPEALAQHALVQDCLVILHNALERQADMAANQLLLLLEDDISGAVGSGEKASNKSAATKGRDAIKKKNNKKKGKKNKGQTQAKTDYRSAMDESLPCSITQDNETISDTSNEPIQITRLEDGRMAVSVSARSTALTSNTSSLNPPMQKVFLPSTPTPSVDSMFRQRFQHNTKTKATAPRADAADSEIDAVMDALCLDVAMLLYTPHGMALNVSPSQLDAVESILQKQIGAVQEARALQESRMTMIRTVPPPPPPSSVAAAAAAVVATPASTDNIIINNSIN